MLHVYAYVPAAIHTCFLGEITNSCPLWDDNPVGYGYDIGGYECLKTDKGGRVLRFNSDLALSPDDPRALAAVNKTCLKFTAKNKDWDMIYDRLYNLKTKIRKWTSGTLRLRLHVIETDEINVSMIAHQRAHRRPFEGWEPIIGLQHIANHLKQYPDFSIIFAPIRDDRHDLHYDPHICTTRSTATGPRRDYEMPFKVGTGMMIVTLNRDSYNMSCTKPEGPMQYTEDIMYMEVEDRTDLGIMNGFLEVLSEARARTVDSICGDDCSTLIPSSCPKRRAVAPHNYTTTYHQMKRLQEIWHPASPIIVNHCKNKQLDITPEYYEQCNDTGGDCILPLPFTGI